MSDLAEKPRLYAERIARSGEMLLGIVNSVLDFSRIEAGEIELKPQATNIEALFGETLDQFRDKATECVSACKSDPHLGDIGVQKWL